MRAIEMLNDVMVEVDDPQQFCTLAAVMLSRERHAGRSAVIVELVLAGHAQPVVVRADGTAELIGRFGTALGLFESVDLHCTRHVLAAGETLLLYTDGITECRRGLEQFDETGCSRRPPPRPARAPSGSWRPCARPCSASPSASAATTWPCSPSVPSPRSLLDRGAGHLAAVRSQAPR